ncbi:hypothetical protein NECAME_09293 [Necator americanus]|uniref:Uncharacterized protein n=1 Tax=Necator americanus TaxID=51031 RepID=W2TDV4_NECAM|nr:hypothetical protein NECAME_09293 [Necator americanus]ETN80240.1 hypothetical protein NECAME_09293 [Necator americanus]
MMTRRQSPDSSIMTYLCGAPHYQCAKMPRWLVSSSNFFMGNRNVTPVVIQHVEYRHGMVPRKQLAKTSRLLGADL